MLILRLHLCGMKVLVVCKVRTVVSEEPAIIASVWKSREEQKETRLLRGNVLSNGKGDGQRGRLLSAA